jgi:purine-binding chemotaxis protein CheW
MADESAHPRLLPPPLSPSAAETGLVQVLTFVLGDEVYGLDVANVYEVSRMVAITPMPDSPRDVLGVIDYRNAIVPILSLRTRFGMKQVPTDLSTPIIIVWTGYHALGLVVDSVHEVRSLSPYDIMEPKEFGQQAPHLSGVARLDDDLILILSPADLLREDTFDALDVPPTTAAE